MLRRRRGTVDGSGAVSLGANTRTLLASRLVQAVLGWVCAVLIARTLSLEDFGEFTLVFTVLGMMSIVTDLGIGRLAVRGMVGDDPVAFAGSYLVLRTLLGLVGYVVALLVVVLGGYPTSCSWATAVAGIVVVLATPSSALDVVFQARHRVGVIGVMDTAGMLAQAALTAAIAAGGGTLLLFTIPAVLYQVVVLAWKLPAAHRLVPVRPRVDVRAVAGDAPRGGAAVDRLRAGHRLRQGRRRPAVEARRLRGRRASTASRTSSSTSSTSSPPP